MKTRVIYISFLFYFFSLIGYAQNRYAYQEEFESQGGWLTGENEIRELSINDGRYYFEHKKDSGGWETVGPSYRLDSSRDFEIETSFIKISGVQGNGMSFLYDYKDEKNFKEFGISSSGYYRIAKSKDGEYRSNVRWTSTPYVNKGNYSSNKLRIKKLGERISFYINDNYVHGMDYVRFVGNALAMKLHLNQKIGIEFFRVKYLSAKKTNVKPVSKMVLFEGFNDKINNWSEIDDDYSFASIENGDYIIKHKIKSDGYAPTISKFIDVNRDFKITTQIKKVSGIDNNGFGLVFGRENIDNQNQFVITSDGSYIIIKTVDGEITYIKNWTESSHIKTGKGAYNYLKIQKIGNKVEFHVNSKLLYTSYSTDFYGDRVGFVVYDRQEISVGYLTINYLDEKE